ncbi:flavodoxin family protein [Peptoniphilus asaccharolyticus]
MRGIVIYSSKTGNTKRAAEYIYESLKEVAEMELASVEEKKNPEDYDFALLGGWIDKALPDGKIRKVIENTKQDNIGIFTTLGAMPDSEHGLKVKENLEEMLSNRNSLGEFRLPGLVDPALIEKMKSFPAKIIPANIREKMIDSGIKSRIATEEELKEVAEFFKENIKNMR